MAGNKNGKGIVDTGVKDWPEGLVGQMNFILRSPDVDPTMRRALLREIEIICIETKKKKEEKEQIDRLERKIEAKSKAVHKMEKVVKEIIRKRSVYYRNSKPIIREAGNCLIYDAFHRITE